MAWAEYAGLRVLSGTVMIPYHGLWVADLALALTSTGAGSANAVPPPTGPLTIGPLQMQAAMFRRTDFGGRSSARFIGGYGGWQTTLQPKAYQNPGGLLLNTILNDAAAEAGEKIGTAALAAMSSTVVGTAYVRPRAPASRVLRLFAEPDWWVDNSGAIQVSDRLLLAASGSTSDTQHLGPILTQFTPTAYGPGQARYAIAHENPDDWMPGRTFAHPLISGTQTVSMVTHRIGEDGQLRTDVLTTTSA